MTNQHHPITPPPELTRQWDAEAATADMPDQVYIATQAARWGADQELEACCDAIYVHEGQPLSGGTAEWLRDARRPSLKQQGLEALEQIENRAISNMRSYAIHDDLVQHAETIRRALKQLDD